MENMDTKPLYYMGPQSSGLYKLHLLLGVFSQFLCNSSCWASMNTWSNSWSWSRWCFSSLWIWISLNAWPIPASARKSRIKMKSKSFLIPGEKMAPTLSMQERWRHFKGEGDTKDSGESPEVNANFATSRYPSSVTCLLTHHKRPYMLALTPMAIRA